MRRALTIAAILAWIVIQIPVMFCSTAGGESLRTIFAGADHACYATSSDTNRLRCAHEQAKCKDSDQPADRQPEDERGEHLIVTVQSSPCGPSVELPACGAAVHGWARSDVLRSAFGIEQATERDFSQLDPPSRPDPVTTFARLQV